MLTSADYNNLWTATFGLPIHLIPCYYQYLQREVYQQDYLDLFSGMQTFHRTVIAGHQTVEIPGLPADPTGAYTVAALGNPNDHRLIVDYDYPFTPAELAEHKKRCIKYILIGEAAPSSGNYIYKDAKGSYITAFLKASGVKSVDKMKTKERLLNFANKRGIVIDMLPFSISFEYFDREKIFKNGNISEILKLVNSSIHSLKTLCKENKNFCFVGPLTSSIAVFNFLKKNKEKVLGLTVETDIDLPKSPDYTDNKGKKHVEYTKNVNENGLGHVTKKARITVAIGGNGPNSHLIKRALSL